MNGAASCSKCSAWRLRDLQPGRAAERRNRPPCPRPRLRRLERSDGDAAADGSPGRAHQGNRPNCGRRHCRTDRRPQPDPPPSPAPAAGLVVARGAGADPAELTKRAIAALGGIERFVKPGADVVVKPNICVAYHGPEYAATTNPDVVAAVVSLCLAAGASRVRVMDAPFGGTATERLRQERHRGGG